MEAWPDAPEAFRPSALHKPILLSVTTEALNNVRKHSNAKNVVMRVGARDGIVALEVVDDGIGIRADADSDPDAKGLSFMRERVSRVGGVIEIRGRPGSGTRLFVRIPQSPFSLISGSGGIRD